MVVHNSLNIWLFIN